MNRSAGSRAIRNGSSSFAARLSQTFALKMPLSTDVIVRREIVTFPPKCVVCSKPVDSEEIRLRGNPVGFYGVIPWLFGATKKLKVPAHLKCGSCQVSP